GRSDDQPDGPNGILLGERTARQCESERGKYRHGGFRRATLIHHWAALITTDSSLLLRVSSSRSIFEWAVLQACQDLKNQISYWRFRHPTLLRVEKPGMGWPWGPSAPVKSYPAEAGMISLPCGCSTRRGVCATHARSSRVSAQSTRTVHPDGQAISVRHARLTRSASSDRLRPRPEAP